MFNRLLAISFWLLAENKQAAGSFKLEAEHYSIPSKYKVCCNRLLLLADGREQAGPWKLEA